jgi:tellurite resistance protein
MTYVRICEVEETLSQYKVRKECTVMDMTVITCALFNRADIEQNGKSKKRSKAIHVTDHSGL